MKKSLLNERLQRTAFFVIFCTLGMQGVKAEVIFSEEHVVGSWNAQQLPIATYPNLRTVREGDVVAITVTAIEEGARVTLQNSSWHGLSGCEEYISEAKTCYFVMNEENAAEIKTNGLIVTGEKYTFNKVEVLYKKSLWTGLVNDNAGWGQSDALDKSIFSSLVEGDLLGVTVSAINDGETWHQYALRYNYESSSIEKTGVSTANTYVHVLTPDQVSQLQEEGKAINIIAQYLCVTELTTYTAFPTSITLTDTEFPYFLPGEYATVNVSRSFLEGYNTIILPFATTAAELTGSEASFAATIKSSDDEGGCTILKFVKVNEMEANKPYLIYVTEDTPIATLRNKSLVSIPEGSWEYQSWDYGDTPANRWYLQGNYTPANEAVRGNYVVSGANTINKAGSSSTLKGLRAYLVNQTSGGVKSQISFVIEDTETGIKCVDKGQLTMENATIYNLAGLRMNMPMKGVNIINGKQVIVK